MKTLPYLVNKWENAEKLAETVINDVSNWANLKKHIESGNDPKSHSLYFAHCVLGKHNAFWKEIEIIHEKDT